MTQAKLIKNMLENSDGVKKNNNVMLESNPV